MAFPQEPAHRDRQYKNTEHSPAAVVQEASHSASVHHLEHNTALQHEDQVDEVDKREGRHPGRPEKGNTAVASGLDRT